MNNERITSNIVRGASVILVITIIAKIVAFLETAVLAFYLGATVESDAYNAVLSIDQVFYPMLGIGIWKIFLPLYKADLVKGKCREADTLADQTISLFLLLTTAIVLLFFIGSEIIIEILFPGFSNETKNLSARLVRISSPMYVFAIMAAIYAAMLQCHNRFAGGQLREIVSHIPVIISAVFFYKKYGVGSLAVGLLIGGFFRLAVAIPFINWKYRFRLNFHFRNGEVGTVLRKYPSAMLIEGVDQINMLIDKIMASNLPVGALSVLSYGIKLTSTLNGLLSVTVSTALYPQIIELATQNDNRSIEKILNKILRLFGFIIIPVAIGCIVFSSEIVSIVYQRGAFDFESVSQTSGTFLFYSVGLFFVASNASLTNTFYAYGNTKRPLQIGIINLVTNVILNLVLISHMGVNGLALATSLSAIVSFIFRIALIKKEYEVNLFGIFGSIAKYLAMAIISILLPRAIFNIFIRSRLVLLFIVVIISATIYILSSKVINRSEYSDTKQIFLKLLRRKR